MEAGEADLLVDSDSDSDASSELSVHRSEHSVSRSVSTVYATPEKGPSSGTSEHSDASCSSSVLTCRIPSDGSWLATDDSEEGESLFPTDFPGTRSAGPLAPLPTRSALPRRRLAPLPPRNTPPGSKVDRVAQWVAQTSQKNIPEEQPLSVREWAEGAKRFVRVEFNSAGPLGAPSPSMHPPHWQSRRCQLPNSADSVRSCPPFL